jgi:glycoprotease/Kae1 family metallohydrolase
MKVLGIESSAHTFGIGIADAGEILSNEKEMFRIGAGGMIPSRVSEFHIRSFGKVLARALKKAGLRLGDIEGVSYTAGPGLGPCLQIGALVAKSVACKLHVKITPVNHSVAHIEIAKKRAGLTDPIVLYVSGGNSQVLKKTKEPFPHYAVLGETLDIGVGNMLDALARGIGLNPAWGSEVARTASTGSYIPMPYTVKGMDFAFSGLLTNAIDAARSGSKPDVCFSIQETAFSMLCEATERAMLLTGSREMVVCGGVAQSKRLKEMLAEIAKEHGARFGFAEDEFNADNGAMVAFVGEQKLLRGEATLIGKCFIRQRFRPDSVQISW